MSREDIKNAVKEVYAARLSNDLERVAALFALDSHFQLSGSAGASPIALCASNRESIVPVLAVLINTWKWIDQQILHLIIDGNQAAVHYKVSMEFRPTGHLIDTNICDLLAFRDGKLAQIIQFVDTALASSLIGSSE